MKIIFANILLGLFISSLAQSIAPVSNEFEAGVVLFRVTDEYDVSHIPVTKDDNVDPALLPELMNIFEKYGIINLSRPALAFEHPVLLRIFRMQFSYTGGIDMLIEELEARKEIIKYAEKNPYMKPFFRPNDPFYGNVDNANFKWHLDRIYAEGAWLIQQGTPNIKVAIVDNYVWGAHPDLNIATSNLYNAYNKINGDASPPSSTTQYPSETSYTNSHGTHVSGLVGAINNNNTGIASIGGGVTLMGIRTSADDGGLMANSKSGVAWAVQNGAKVINMSYGSSYYSRSDEETFRTYAESGVVLVAAAGNEGDEENYVSYPAGYSSVISVASIDGDEKLSYFSQHGADRADIAAPGGFINNSPAYPNVLSTTYCSAYMLSSTYPSLSNTYYDGMQGTSMSSPVVAGLCGLLLSFDPTLTPTQIKTLLQQTASPIHPNSATNIGGNGYVNAFAALMELNKNVSIFKASSDSLICPYNEYVDSILVISHQEWTIIGNIPTWMTVTTNNYYENSKRLVFHIDKNFSIYPRSCELSFYSAALDSTIKINILQVAHPRTVDVDKKIIRISKGQNSISLLHITANVHWWMTTGTMPSWLTISDTTADTSQIITFTATTENTADSNQSYLFILSGDGVPDIQMEVIQYTEELTFSVNKDIITLGSSNRAIDTLWIISNTDWVITGYDTNLVSIYPTSGNGTGYIVIRAKTSNSSYTTNTTTGLFYLNGIEGKNIIINQRAVDFLLLPEDAFTLGATRGSVVEVPVRSNMSWEVYTASSASWVSPDITSGKDSLNIVFTALSANETGKVRSIKYYVKAISSLRTVTITQDFTGDVSITANNNTEKEPVQIYPNPANDFVNISTQRNLIKQVQILEILGNTVQTISFTEQAQVRIDCSNLAAGLYILQISLNDNSVVTKRISKQ
ncbi:MAG: S8 family serine peptidase [Bacteroidales bacterium]|nr:S8 family serine peptidase [Bacteroidales bacterium]